MCPEYLLLPGELSLIQNSHDPLTQASLGGETGSSCFSSAAPSGVPSAAPGGFWDLTGLKERQLHPTLLALTESRRRALRSMRQEEGIRERKGWKDGKGKKGKGKNGQESEGKGKRGSSFLGLEAMICWA